MKTFFLSLFSILFLNAMVEEQINKIAGVYSLTGVMETASAFKLNKDSTFEFYFSYGALDRSGSGKWSFYNNKIILNSIRIYPGKDYAIKDSSSTVVNETIIKIQDANTNLYRFVYCLYDNKDDSVLNANEEGIIIIPQRVDSIRLVSELCAERVSTFVLDKKHNSYTFGFEPWITDIFFNNFKLNYKGDHLEGEHPLRNDKKIFTYKKEQ